MLQTSPEMAHEAEYRGANPITEAEVGGYGLRDLVADLVGTDAEHVAQMEGKEKVYLPDRKLGEAQLKALKVLRRVAKRAGIRGRIAAYILPPDHDRRAMMAPMKPSTRSPTQPQVSKRRSSPVHDRRAMMAPMKRSTRSPAQPQVSKRRSPPVRDRRPAATPMKPSNRSPAQPQGCKRCSPPVRDRRVVAVPTK